MHQVDTLLLLLLELLRLQQQQLLLLQSNASCSNFREAKSSEKYKQLLEEAFGVLNNILLF